MENLSEFRKDLVSGEWVLFATGRARRPDEIGKNKKLAQPKDKCPFENPENSGNEVVATYYNPDQSDWTIKIAKNKFPAVQEGEAGPRKKEGPFEVLEARGSHEVVIFRDHDKDFQQFTNEEMSEVIRVYQERYLHIAGHNSSKYILIFHNKGASAGASIGHPHSQIMSMPILPPDVGHSIRGSENFYKEHGRRVYDDMIAWEMKEKKRIVFENEKFVAFCPFVSRVPYEVRIFSRESHAHFEKMSAELRPILAEAMITVLGKIHAALGAPDYNFFIHTAPIEDDISNAHDFYSWHVEILPKTSMMGAFELGSGIDVNIIDPDRAAQELRKA